MSWAVGSPLCVDIRHTRPRHKAHDFTRPDAITAHEPASPETYKADGCVFSVACCSTTRSDKHRWQVATRGVCGTWIRSRCPKRRECVKLLCESTARKKIENAFARLCLFFWRKISDHGVISPRWSRVCSARASGHPHFGFSPSPSSTPARAHPGRMRAVHNYYPHRARIAEKDTRSACAFLLSLV